MVAVGPPLISSINEVAFHAVLLKLCMQIQCKLYCKHSYLQCTIGKQKHCHSFSSALIACRKPAHFSPLQLAVCAPSFYSLSPADPQVLSARSTEVQEGLTLEEPLILFCLFFFFEKKRCGKICVLSVCETTVLFPSEIVS